MNIETAEKVSGLLLIKKDLENTVRLLSDDKSCFGFITNTSKIKGIGVEDLPNFTIRAFPFNNKQAIKERMLKFYILELQEIDNQIKQIQC